MRCQSGEGIDVAFAVDFVIPEKRWRSLFGGIAVAPDDSRIFCSDFKLKALRIVDPTTLADIAVVPLKSAKATNFQPRGVGVLPDGSKVYAVCAAVMPTSGQISSTVVAGASCFEFFCAVVRTETQDVVKRMPLDAY